MKKASEYEVVKKYEVFDGYIKHFGNVSIDNDIPAMLSFFFVQGQLAVPYVRIPWGESHLDPRVHSFWIQSSRTGKSIAWNFISDIMEKAEIPFGVVNRLEDLKDDPQLKSLGFFREYSHPSEGKLEVPDSAFRYNRQSLPVRRHQPKLGEHSEEILREAGFDNDEICSIIDD